MSKLPQTYGSIERISTEGTYLLPGCEYIVAPAAAVKIRAFADLLPAEREAARAKAREISRTFIVRLRL